MKKYLITGLVIMLPLALTLVIVAFIFNLLTEPFVGIVKAILDYYNILENGFLFLSAGQLQKYTSQLIIIALLFFFTAGLGWLARWFFINYLIGFWDDVLHRIPLISRIYKTCQDIIQTLFKSQTKSFKQVVMVPFPSHENQVIGLVSRDDLPAFKQNEKPLVAVFVPTTPNPTSGFLVMYEEKDLVYLDMSVEDALKYVISCGMIASPISPESQIDLLRKFNKKPPASS